MTGAGGATTDLVSPPAAEPRSVPVTLLPSSADSITPVSPEPAVADPAAASSVDVDSAAIGASTTVSATTGCTASPSGVVIISGRPSPGPASSGGGVAVASAPVSLAAGSVRPVNERNADKIDGRSPPESTTGSSVADLGVERTTPCPRIAPTMASTNVPPARAPSRRLSVGRRRHRLVEGVW
jgi:hypothetical protein